MHVNIYIKIYNQEQLSKKHLGNYTNDQPQSYGGGGPRSTYGNDIGQYPQAGDDYKRYLNQNIKQII